MHLRMGNGALRGDGTAGPVYNAATVLAGTAAALAVPEIPLRLSAPGLLFLTAVLLWRGRRTGSTVATALPAAAWFWCVACVVVAGGGAAGGLLLAALALLLPAAVAAARRQRPFSLTADGGVALAAVALAVPALATTPTPHSAGIPYRPLGALLAGGLLAYAAVRGGLSAGGRRALSLALLLPCVALAATLAAEPSRLRGMERPVTPFAAPSDGRATPHPDPLPQGERESGGVVQGTGVVFDASLQLVTAALSDTAPAPGDTVDVRFAWRLLRPLPPDWRVFVHVRQRTYGGYLLQYDHAFADVGIDVAAWLPGEVRRTTLPLAIPEDTPRSRALLLVGIWDGDRNRPVAVCDDPGRLRLAGAGRVIAGDITVRP